MSFLECSDFINRFDLEVKPTFFGMSKAGGGGRGEPIINYCTLIVSFTISPLQLAIHEVQNRHPGKRGRDALGQDKQYAISEFPRASVSKRG